VNNAAAAIAGIGLTLEQADRKPLQALRRRMPKRKAQAAAAAHRIIRQPLRAWTEIGRQQA
jgi:hypothetical protein